MDNINNIQDFPQNLELTDWLKFSLTSYNEYARQIALEELTVNGVNPDFVDILTNISENDPSQSCRSQAKWLLKLSETKVSLKQLIKKFDITPDFITLQVQKGDFAKLTLISQMLRKAPRTDTILLWRETLQKTTDPHLIQVGLDILCKFGDESDTNLALRFIQDNDSQVVCSAFSLLSRNKDLFKKHIGIGLSSKSADVILHSIQLFRTINEPEAIKYLSRLILNKNPLVRQKALREFMLIKFEKVEDLFWQYMAREDQSFLLVKVGLLATFNPAQHFPYKLYDIMSVATGVKKHILQLILKQTIATASSSGVIKSKDINTYLNEIKQYISNKRVEQTIRLAVSNLNSDDTTLRSDSVEKLSHFKSHPKIKALFIEQFKIEKDEKIKAILASLLEDVSFDEIKQISQKEVSNNVRQNVLEELGNNSLPLNETQCDSSNGKNEVVPEKQEIGQSQSSNLVQQERQDLQSEKAESQLLTSFPEKNEFIQLSFNDQCSWLKKIDSLENYHISKKTLLEVADSDVSIPVLLDILKIIGDYGKPEDAKAIYHLTQSQDYSVVAQTIKSVGACDLERLFPDLNNFLSHDDPRVKSAAFSIYALADKEAAIQYIGSMLKDSSDSIRRMGLSLVPQIDYPSAEPLLWWVMAHETNVEIQDQVGYMVAANPTREGITKMYAFTHDTNGEVKEGMLAMWKTALATAETVLGVSKSEIEQKCFDSQSAISQEENREQTDYKFNSAISEYDDDSNDMEKDDEGIITKSDDNILTQILFHVYEYKYYYISCICVFVVILYFIINSGSSNDVHRVNQSEMTSKASFVSDETLPDVKTQVGGEDWVDGIKSGASIILGSSNYASVIQRAANEQNAYREEAERKEKEYYEELANDRNASQEDRDWAASKLNENLQNGLKAFKNGNYNEAESLLEKAAFDPTLNTYGKIEAMQKLIEISDNKNDKNMWMKWMTHMLREAKNNTDYFKNVAAFDDFENTMAGIKQVQDMLNGDSNARSIVLKSFKDEYKYSDNEAQQALDQILNFKSPHEAKRDF